MPTPLLVLTDQTVPDAIVVVVMVVVEVYLLLQILPRRGGAPAIPKMVLLTSLLVGSAAFLMTLIGAFLQSNLNSYTIVLLMFNYMMLAPPGLWMITVVIFQDRRIDPASWTWPVVIVALATLSEVLMGLFFTVAQATDLSPLPVLAGTLTSPWYLWSMSAAMLALIAWFPLSRGVRGVLAGVAAAGAVAPWVADDPLVGAVLMTAVMVATLGFVVREASLGRSDPHLGGVLYGAIAAFGAMSVAGVAVAVAPGPGALLAFGAILTATMVGEFLYLARRALLGPIDAPSTPVGTALDRTDPIGWGLPPAG